MEPVTEVLQARAAAPGGMERMLVLSFLVHGAILATLMLAPPSWRGRQQAPRMVMTISLAGSPGPVTGGMTPISARPIQQAIDQPQRQPVRPPAAVAPPMTVPAQAVRTKPQPRTPVASSEGKSRTPTTGAQTQPGTATVETGAKGEGFGLSSGGGEGTGSHLDVGNFCCPEYLVTMQQLIRRNWEEKQPVGGEAMVKFTIQRTGAITDVELERSSGQAVLDLASQRALLQTRQLPPLPSQFPDSKLTVHLSFQYRR